MALGRNKLLLKTLKGLMQNRYLFERYFKIGLKSLKSSGQWNLIRQVVFNADNSSREGLDAVRG